MDMNVKDIVKEVILELRKQKFVDDNFSRTEKLLYNYPYFKEALKEKRIMLEEIERYGVPTKSKSIAKYCGGSCGLDSGDPLQIERLEKLKNDLQVSIFELENYLMRIELALEFCEHDRYPELIKMRYFERKNIAEIAGYYGVGETSILRARDRLVDKIKAHLFSRDVLEVLLK